MTTAGVGSFTNGAAPCVSWVTHRDEMVSAVSTLNYRKIRYCDCYHLVISYHTLKNTSAEGLNNVQHLPLG